MVQFISLRLLTFSFSFIKKVFFLNIITNCIYLGICVEVGAMTIFKVPSACRLNFLYEFMSLTLDIYPNLVTNVYKIGKNNTKSC